MARVFDAFSSDLGIDLGTSAVKVIALDDELKNAEKQHAELWRMLPNLLADDVPLGKTDEDNVEIKRWGEPKDFGFEPRDHLQLGEITGTIDFERGAKVTGANFYYLLHEVAILEHALLAYASSKVVPEGFIPTVTPDLARDDILSGIGFQPRGPETQIYSVEGMDLSLIGTAEITLGGLHGDEILDGALLPRKYLGFSRCFRTEAGSHGRESKGLYRVHQFTKAEMFILCRPEDSAQQHENILALEEAIFQGLDIPYRVVNVCGGDLGQGQVQKFDVECWMPGRGAYGETHSASRFHDFQSRRLKMRYRDADKKTQYCHTLNNTVAASTRMLLALMENHQQADGRVWVPEPLRPYLGGRELLGRVL